MDINNGTGIHRDQFRDQDGDVQNEVGSTQSSEKQRRRQSLSSAGINYPQKETLRGKLIEPHVLDDDEVRMIVGKVGIGCSLENISKLSRSTMDSIKQVEFVDPKKDNKDATRMQIGRAIYEFCVNMIIPCGEAVVTAIKYDFDINSEIELLARQKSAITDQIVNRKQSFMIVHKPDLSVVNARIDLAVGKHDLLLQHKYRGINAVRINVQQAQAQVPGVQQSPPALATRSTSRERDRKQQSEQQVVDGGHALEEKESWEGSFEQEQYRRELQDYANRIKTDHLDKFFAQQDAWEGYEASRHAFEADLLRLEEEKKNLQALEIMYQEMRNQISTIVQKVKSAVQPHSFIREQLASQIVVNEKTLFQPIYSDNLCGIFHLLHREYSTATFELFCTFLMDLLSITATAEELATNPYVVAQRTDVKLKMWLDFKLEQFMTPDHLFTIANLKTLQGDVRKDAMTRVLEKARQLEVEGADTEAALEYAGMPLYSALVRYEKTLSETSTFPSGNKVKSNVVAKPPTLSGSGALEQAAAASDSGPRRPAVGPYNYEVTREHDLWTSNLQFRYTGTKAACPDCTARTGKHVGSACYSNRCTNCGYYGHRPAECKHTLRPGFTPGGGGKRS